MWGGLWELPRGTRQDGEALEETAARSVCEAAGVSVHALRPFGVVKHVVANRRITLHGFEAEFSGEVLGSVRHAWVSAEDRTRHAVATPQAKLMELLWKQETQGRLEF